MNEFSGNGGTEGSYLLYASTSYSYNPLDLLTQVSDGNGKLTSISYDTLGRKMSMSDPTMGGWSYGYDHRDRLSSWSNNSGSSSFSTAN